MNVKSFLAGRKGLCPTCGAKIDIPFQSDPEVAGDNTSGQTAAATAATEAVDESTDTIVLDLPYLAAPPAVPSEPWASPNEPADAEHQSAIGSDAPSADMNAAAETVRHSARASAAPSTKWYMRLGSGEQFGPVREEVMRQWFDEGRIAANTPIWRDGWTDWRPASSVFRDSGDLVATPPEVPAKPMSSGDLSEALTFSRSGAVAKVEQRRTWTQKQWRTFISLTLLGLIVILGTILLVMLLSQFQQPDSQPPPASSVSSPLSDSSKFTRVLARAGGHAGAWSAAIVGNAR